MFSGPTTNPKYLRQFTNMQRAMWSREIVILQWHCVVSSMTRKHHSSYDKWLIIAINWCANCIGFRSPAYNWRFWYVVTMYSACCSRRWTHSFCSKISPREVPRGWDCLHAAASVSATRRRQCQRPTLYRPIVWGEWRRLFGRQLNDCCRGSLHTKVDTQFVPLIHWTLASAGSQMISIFFLFSFVLSSIKSHYCIRTWHLSFQHLLIALLCCCVNRR